MFLSKLQRFLLVRNIYHFLYQRFTIIPNFGRFGCCSDGETPADGPNEEGCEEKLDCNNFGPDKKYPGFGCCPNGKTLAQGPEKQGCFECPEEVLITSFIIVAHV